MKISESILSLVVAAILLVAARALAGCAAVQPPAPATAAAAVTATAPATVAASVPATVAATVPPTGQIQFDPASITPSADQPVLAGECVASVRVPRAGAYSCAAETGANFDPCFVLAEGGDLGCQPNPPAGRYSAIVKATNAPLLPGEGGAKPVPFYLRLETGKPSCAVGVSAPMQLDGQEVTWRCEAPGAWIVGELRTDRPDWRADYVVTDSSGTKVTYGPEESLVVEAWLY